METLTKGDVVAINFPFSDLSSAKKRPAYVLAVTNTQETILCQITTVLSKDIFSETITNNDFDKGSLKIKSDVRLNKLFTADNSLIKYKIGTLKKDVINNLTRRIIEMIK